MPVTQASPGARKALLAGLWVVLLAMAGALAYAGAAVDYYPWEVSVSAWVQSWRAPWLDVVMKAVSLPGLMVVALPMSLVILGLLYLKGLRAECLLLVASTALGYAAREAIKALVTRPRPPAELVEVLEELEGYSFPSGHVFHYVMFFGALLIILRTGKRPGAASWLAQGALAVLILLVGLSRVYLGMHWLGDVIAGYYFGALTLAGTFWAWQRGKRMSGRH